MLRQTRSVIHYSLPTYDNVVFNGGMVFRPFLSDGEKIIRSGLPEHAIHRFLLTYDNVVFNSSIKLGKLSSPW
jgi:hypothetical protein